MCREAEAKTFLLLVKCEDNISYALYGHLMVDRAVEFIEYEGKLS